MERSVIFEVKQVWGTPDTVPPDMLRYVPIPRHGMVGPFELIQRAIREKP